jgi:hypothetical protein
MTSEHLRTPRVSERDAALAEIERIDALRSQGLTLTDETNAAYAELVEYVKVDTTALVDAVKEAADAVKYDQEIKDAQANVADRVALLESALGALQAIRKDDERARRDYRRAVNAAVKAGVSEADLATITQPVSKMPDLNGWPGVGEGAWFSTYGRS